MRKRPFLLNAFGFTLAEALLAAAMGAIFLVSAVSTWTYSTKTWKEESVRSELRYNVEKSLEEIKNDLRLTDGSKILFYPAGDTTYTAVSLPREYVNVNGLYDISGGITWSETVIYHVYENELLRTLVDYNSSAATRQAQLDEAATTGTVTGGETSVMFSADSAAVTLTPTNPEYDGYASSLEESSSISFGTIQLTPGNHTLRFEITGKNNDSSGYKIGLDSIALNPSGCEREAEALTVSNDSGGANTIEDMSSFSAEGLWGGNHQLEYQSSGIGDFIEFQVYNDAWLESNFADMTHTYTEVTGTDPVLTVASRENQGLSPNWRADVQTAATEADDPSSLEGLSVRNVVNGSLFTRPASMVRFKFRAASNGNLVINSAYVGLRDPGTENFSGSATQLYFGNAAVAPGGSDGVGATGSTGNPNISIAPDYYVWSNWVEFPITIPSADDYLVSFSVDGAAGNGADLYWEPGGGSDNSYVVSGDRASDADTWIPSPPDPGYDSHTAIHAVAEMQSWYGTSTAESQVYDTKMSAPVYGDVSWDNNGSGSYLIKVRSSDDSEMAGASAWTSLSGNSSSGTAISGAGNGRYVQFQAALTAESPFTTYPQMDDVEIAWPGQTTLVEIVSNITKRPNYGKFSVTVDGQDVVNALQLDLDASKTFQGKVESISISTESKPKNTGK